MSIRGATEPALRSPTRGRNDRPDHDVSMVNINGREYVKELPEHGVIRGRFARTTIDGVPYVLAEKVPLPPVEGIMVSELLDILRTLDFDSVLVEVREMVSKDGKLHSRAGSGAYVDTMIDLLRSAKSYARVTLDGVPVIGVQDGQLLTGATA